MQTLPSKELLQDVLDLTLHGLNPLHLEQRGKEIWFYFVTNEDGAHDLESINLYELAHKCKEWSITKGFMLASLYGYEGVASCTIYEEIDAKEKVFEAETEPEAIFKACQWLLDNQ